MPHNRFEWIDRLKFVERDENKGTAFVFGLIARAEDSDSAPTVKAVRKNYFSNRIMTMGPNGVVPIRQDRARLEPGPSSVCRPHLPPCGVLLRIQDRPAMESCGRPRPAMCLSIFS